MNLFSSLTLLATLGVLSAVATDSAAAVDTSQWSCETCPFEKAGVTGSLDLGAAGTSAASPRFGDYTGLKRKGGYVLADGELRWRGEAGLFGEASAADLGLASRQLAARIGQEGLYTLRLGYAELPHQLSSGAQTPYQGVGGSLLTLPTGFASVTSTAMPLASTLQPVEIGFKRTRSELGGALRLGGDWGLDVQLRQDVREGTQRASGSFFANAVQLVAPLDQTTKQVDVAAHYSGRQVQARLAYHASLFRNADEALDFANPFAAAAGAGRGQLALPPDNQFHQLSASLGYEITPKLRASADVAVGRMTQDAAYVPPTLNPLLVVPALPAASLDGKVSTLNASLRLSAAATNTLRINASYTRDERDNETASLAYPALATDLFVAAAARSNQPYSFTQDRFKLGADLRGPGSLKLAFGLLHDRVERTLQEVGATREALAWGRMTMQPLKDLSLALKLAHGERKRSDYLPVAAIEPAQNPLLRKYNLADRKRDTGGLRADYVISETVSVGVSADWAWDDYNKSRLGLLSGHSVNGGLDLSVALTDETQLLVFAQEERLTARQAGSTLFAQPDWQGLSRDTVDVLGITLKHLALKGKLELNAQASTSRSRSSLAVDTGAASAGFPTVSTALDTFKLQANWQMNPQLSLIGSWQYERYDSRDWHLDGVQPGTVPNLLAYGEWSPRYHVNLVRMAVRYRF